MKKIVLIIVFTWVQLNAQTGIGTTTPNASAKLEVYATNKGFLPPRVTLTSATDATTIASPAEGLLVYNLGSVGLQSGYYYWNGANWATIATASSAGNGVTSTDLVKLYGKAYSTATGDIANASGYSFTVPVSGRYLFDFSCSAWGGIATINFKVRQGTTDLGTDTQTSLNNNVHVEYNGKVEVNLQSGTTYNVFVSTTGNRDSGDYDRVYYKMVAGNLPVTGQSVDYVQATLLANQSLSSAGNISFSIASGAGITQTNGGFNLLANKTYKLEAALGGTSGGYAYYGWVDSSNTLLPGGSIGVIMKAGSAYTDAPQDKAVVMYTPTANTTVYLRVLNVSGGVVAYAPPVGNNYSSTWATIQQVGSSAIVNPWVLSGNDVYNTTGKVGIGNTNPNSKLDVRTSPTSTSDPGSGSIGVGTSSATASLAGAGALRYTTSGGRLEVSDGSSWKATHGPIFAQFQGNTPQSITTVGTKVNFSNTVINVGGITITANNSITLPVGRIYRVDFNVGWVNINGGWARFAIFNSGNIASVGAHLEAVNNSFWGNATGMTTTFINTTAGSTTIDVRYVSPSPVNITIGDSGNNTSYPYIVIQAVD